MSAQRPGELDVSGTGVAVVIAAYRAAATVARAVRSAKGQRGVERVIVVDDGSGDETGRIAREAGAEVITQENAGPAAARNRGMEEAGGAVVFLDADDELMPGAADALVRAAGAVKGCACAIGGHVEVSEDGTETRRGGREEWVRDGRIDDRALVLGTEHVFCTTGLMLSAGAAAAGVRFDESARFAEDRDLIYRAAAHGPIAVTDFCTVRKHRPAGRMTADAGQVGRWLSDQLTMTEKRLGEGCSRRAMEELERAAGWVLKHACRVLARRNECLSAEEWRRVCAVYKRAGWRVPRSAVKWRAVGRVRGVVLPTRGGG